MQQVSQKTVANVAFQQALEYKKLQTNKIQQVLDKETDGKIIDILKRMLREEASHLDTLEQKSNELKLS